MTKPLHEQVDTPDSEEGGADDSGLDATIKRHLGRIEDTATDTLPSRVGEVKAVLDGDVPDGIADTEGLAPDRTTSVAASRLLEAATRLQRKAAHLYALAALRDKTQN